jgi:hypothetical protein
MTIAILAAAVPMLLRPGPLPVTRTVSQLPPLVTLRKR